MAARLDGNSNKKSEFTGLLPERIERSRSLLIEAGKVMSVISERCPLSEVPEAIRHFDEGYARG